MRSTKRIPYSYKLSREKKGRTSRKILKRPNIITIILYEYGKKKKGMRYCESPNKVGREGRHSQENLYHIFFSSFVKKKKGCLT